MKLLNWCDSHALLVVFALIALMMLPVVVFAQVTYVYTGAVMTGTLTGQNAFPGATQITGIVVVPPLNPNEANQVVTPLAFFFLNSALSSLQYPSPPQVTSSFSFSTVNGVISAWNVQIYFNSGDTLESLSSTQSGDQYTFDQVSLDCFYQSGVVCSYWNASSTSNGVWTILLDDQVQAQLDTANQMIVAYQKELNNMLANNRYMAKLLARK